MCHFLFIYVLFVCRLVFFLLFFIYLVNAIYIIILHSQKVKKNNDKEVIRINEYLLVSFPFTMLKNL